MHSPEKSDSAIVAVKPANKAGKPAAEPVEPRAGTKGNASQQSMRRAQDRESVSQALERVRQAARQRKKERFTALLHHLNLEMLRTAFFALKRGAAPGVDGLTWKDYEADLDRRIEDLHARVHRGAYRAQPSRRRYIPKSDGRQRPLAVAALEDKIVQRATAAVLNAIFEEDFLGFSYGFRPKRGQHDALDEGTKGPRLHDWAYLELADLDAGQYNSVLAGEWTRGLLIRRNIADGDLAFFSTWCPKGMPMEKLVSVEGHRWAIEESFEAAKNELGLDHNETRSWHGWHRHVSLVTLAFAMMTAIRHRANAGPPKKTMLRRRTRLS